jgi:hypothetical protein
MRINIRDDNENWLRWANLLQTWIDSAGERPTSVGELRHQLDKNGIWATVAGPDEKTVTIQDYPDAEDELVIMIPNKAMRDAKLATVRPGPYNVMPLFYDIAYGGAPRVPLSAQEAHNFALRRIGEYSVNECC